VAVARFACDSGDIVVISMLLQEAAVGGQYRFNLRLCCVSRYAQPDRKRTAFTLGQTEGVDDQSATLRFVVTSSATSSPGIAWVAYREYSGKMVNAKLSNACRLRRRAGTPTEIFVFPVT
jgi:hypothetical protein